MREYRILIEPFSYIAIRKLDIEKKVNDHGKAEIAIVINDQWKEEYIEILTKETWVKIVGVGEGAVHTVLFYGYATDFSFHHNGYETVLELELRGGTILMDAEPHFRIFQNEENLCFDIHEKLIKNYPKAFKIYCQEGSGEKIQGVYIQYKETDWEFLKRMTGQSGHYIVPDFLKKGISYTIGLPEGIKRQVDTNRITIKLNRGEYMKKLYNGLSFLEAGDMTELVFSDREIFHLGDYISYGGRKYFIWKIETEYKQEEWIHTYYFRTKEGIMTLPIFHENIVGCSFDGIITQVKKDKVQVDIEGDEWKGEDGKKWFLYATVYSSLDGTGWYCMPEVGDRIRLYIPEMERDSFILSAVHKETDSARQNPDFKSLKTKYGKEILFTPDSIIMTNHQGMTVEMNDKEGISIVSDKDIIIEAEDNLTISSENGSLLIGAQDSLQVKQGGTTMTLKEDIFFTGGEFRIQ